MSEDVRSLIEIQDRTTIMRSLASRSRTLESSRWMPHAWPHSWSANDTPYSPRDAGTDIATVEGARLRNLRARPYASMVVMDGDERAQHRAVIVEGPVLIHERAGPEDADRRFGEHWRTRHGDDATWAAALLELRPERVFSFDGTLE